MKKRCDGCGKMLGSVENGEFKYTHGTHESIIEGIAVRCTKCGMTKIIKFSQETSEFTAQKAVDSNGKR